MTRILVFVSPGCGACHDYMPRLRRLSGPYDIDIHVFDVTEGVGTQYMVRFKIRATPTTVVIDGGTERFRRIGSIPDSDIVTILDRATRI